jgi:hypothetical protein
MVSPPHRTSTPVTTPPQMVTAEAIAPAPEAVAPPAGADIPDVLTKTDGLPAEAAPAPITKVAEKPTPTRVAEKPKPIVKKVGWIAHRRSSHRAYAQYNGWG